MISKDRVNLYTKHYKCVSRNYAQLHMQAASVSISGFVRTICKLCGSRQAKQQVNVILQSDPTAVK